MTATQFASRQRIVEFTSEGASLRGSLYLHSGRPGGQPIVIMTHGYSATIDGMVADNYAEALYQAGFAVLLYDHRNFGISGGEPRQEINPWIQARGYRDAIDFVLTLPEIDVNRVAVWGDSLSAAEAIVVGALDARVRAIVAQVPACGGRLPADDSNGSRFRALRETFLRADLHTFPKEVDGPLPVVSFDQASVPSLLTPLSAFHWFIEYGARHGTHWENQATEVYLQTPAPFSAVLCAPHVRAPLLMVIAKEDEMPGANSDVARTVYALAPSPKTKVEVDGGHFGLLYHPSPLFDEVSRIQGDFLSRYLQ